MERAPYLPPRFLYTREIDSRRHNEYCREICELLHRVVTIEAVRLWREVEVGVQHEGIPGLHEYIPGGGHQTFPLRAGQKTDDEEDPGEHKPVHRDEVPGSRNSDGVAVARSRNHGGDIARVILSGLDAVFRYFDRDKPHPLRSSSAVVVPVETWMVHEARQATSDQHEEQEHVGEVTPTNPERKSVRTARRTFDGGRRWGNLRQTEHHVLEPRQRDRAKDRDKKQNQRRSIQPYAKTLIVSLGIISQPLELIIIEVAVYCSQRKLLESIGVPDCLIQLGKPRNPRERLPRPLLSAAPQFPRFTEICEYGGTLR